MNKRGFTLIEMLAVVAILGILSTIASVLVSRYLNRANTSAYDTMAQSLYESSQNYIMDHMDLLEKTSFTINSSDLLENDYIDEMKNPKNENENCTADISIKNNNINNEMSNLEYTIIIKCGSKTITSKFPK